VVRAAKLADRFPEIMSTRPLVVTQKRPEKHANKMWQRQWSSPKTTTGKFYIKHSPTALFSPAFLWNREPSKCPSPKFALTSLTLTTSYLISKHVLMEKKERKDNKTCTRV
jgi:hypothetical protein